MIKVRNSLFMRHATNTFDPVYLNISHFTSFSSFYKHFTQVLLSIIFLRRRNHLIAKPNSYQSIYQLDFFPSSRFKKKTPVYC